MNNISPPHPVAALWLTKLVENKFGKIYVTEKTQTHTTYHISPATKKTTTSVAVRASSPHDRPRPARVCGASMTVSALSLSLYIYIYRERERER